MIPSYYFIEDSDEYSKSDNNELYQYNDYEYFITPSSTNIMKLCYNNSITVDKILNLKHEIGEVDATKTTALMYYCEHNGENPEIINALSDEIGMQDMEGYTALMNLMLKGHKTINIDCINVLQNEIGLRNDYCESALDLFCANHYKNLDRGLANQIIYTLKSEYSPTHYYNGVDIKGLLIK